MKLVAFLTLGFAAIAMASPMPEAEAAGTGLAESIAASLPHALTPADKIMTPEAPSNLVTRQGM